MSANHVRYLESDTKSPVRIHASFIAKWSSRGRGCLCSAACPCDYDLAIFIIALASSMLAQASACAKLKTEMAAKCALMAWRRSARSVTKVSRFNISSRSNKPKIRTDLTHSHRRNKATKRYAKLPHRQCKTSPSNFHRIC